MAAVGAGSKARAGVFAQRLNGISMNPTHLRWVSLLSSSRIM